MKQEVLRIIVRITAERIIIKREGGETLYARKDGGYWVRFPLSFP
jgi:hypothetical protein